MVLGGLCIHVARLLMLLYRILQSKSLVSIYVVDFFFIDLFLVCFFFFPNFPGRGRCSYYIYDLDRP